MADVTWFKVLTDMFADDKIKIIQSMPEGDSLLVMWFKVLSQAGKTNDGGYIYLRKNIPYTTSMLATLFNKQQMIVELALKTFEQFEMIDIDENGYIFVTNWEKHQSIDKLSKLKENDRIRSANYRERKRMELNNNHVTVTLPSQSNHAIEIEVEIDKEKASNYDDVDRVFKSYCRIHKKAEHHATDQFTLIERKLKEGYTADLIISVMEERYKDGVNSFRYYHNPLSEAKQIDREADLQKRKAEERNNVVEMVFKPDPILDKAVGHND